MKYPESKVAILSGAIFLMLQLLDGFYITCVRINKYDDIWEKLTYSLPEHLAELAFYVVPKAILSLREPYSLIPFVSFLIITTAVGRPTPLGIFAPIAYTAIQLVFLLVALYITRQILKPRKK